jgi:hypothetical protein
MIGRSGDSVPAKHEEHGRENAQRRPEKIEPQWLPHVYQHEWNENRERDVMKVFEMTRSPAVRKNVEFIRLVFPF